MNELQIEGVFMHFPVADSLEASDEAFCRTQYARFTAMLDALKAVGVEPELRHCCNSGASILYPQYAMDMVRPGIATYGILPSEELRGRIDLRPVMQLRSTIFQIRDYAPDITISYGRTYRTEAPTRVAVVGIGYADGLPRSFSNRISFLLHGKRVPQIGRICMDMCMVDITSVPNAKVGDELTLFGYDEDGQRVPVERLAEASGTISYEILCTLSKRIARLYYSGGRQSEILQYIV